MIVYPAAAVPGDMAGGAIAGVVGRADCVGDTGPWDTSGEVDVVVELSGAVVVVVLVGTVVVLVMLLGTVVVVPVGAVVAVVVIAVVVVAAVVVIVVVAVPEVAVMVDGAADTVTVLGSAVTVIVDVSVGGLATVTVDIEVGAAVPGTRTLSVAWNERLAVAVKLALTDAVVESEVEASVVMAVVVMADVDSVAGTVPSPGSGSVESAVGGAVQGAAAGADSEKPPGAGNSLVPPDVVLVFVTVVWLRAGLLSRVRVTGWPANASAWFARTAGLESARTKSVIPIAVVTSAATTPARDICRPNRSADVHVVRPHHRTIRGRGTALMSGSATGASLLSRVPIQLLPSSRMC